MIGQRKRKRALTIARRCEKDGDIDRAVDGYLQAYAFDDAARCLIGAKRTLDAGKVLLHSVGISSDLKGLSPRRIAKMTSKERIRLQKAAICITKARKFTRAAKIYIALKDYRRAIELFRRAGDHASAAKLETEMLTQSSGRARNPEEAMQIARSLEAQGNFPAALQAYIRAKNLSKAAQIAFKLKNYEQAAQLYNETGMPYEAALCFTQSKNEPAALNSFVTVPQNDPRYREACVQAIELAIKTDQLAFALENFLSKYLSDGPNDNRDTKHFLQIATLFEKHGHIESAKNAIIKILEQSPRHTEAKNIFTRLQNSARGTDDSFAKVLADDYQFRAKTDSALHELPNLPDLPDLPPQRPGTRPPERNPYSQRPGTRPPERNPYHQRPGTRPPERRSSMQYTSRRPSPTREPRSALVNPGETHHFTNEQLPYDSREMHSRGSNTHYNNQRRSNTYYERSSQNRSSQTRIDDSGMFDPRQYDSRMDRIDDSRIDDSGHRRRYDSRMDRIDDSRFNDSRPQNRYDSRMDRVDDSRFNDSRPQNRYDSRMDRVDDSRFNDSRPQNRYDSRMDRVDDSRINDSRPQNRYDSRMDRIDDSRIDDSGHQNRYDSQMNRKDDSRRYKSKMDPSKIDSSHHSIPAITQPNPSHSKPASRGGATKMAQQHRPKTQPAPEDPLWRGLVPGSVLDGRYKLQKKLGEGGMAVVFSALDKELNDQVALKIFTQSADKEMVQRFKQELSLSRKLNHPNIIRLYDIGQYQGHRFISMEILSGRDMNDLIVNPVDLKTGLNWLVYSARGLHAAHIKGVVHRDIKPHNIFICDDGSVKVMDFGIAKQVHAPGMTVGNMIAGTPEYMSPEQIGGFSSVGPSTDIYALGIVAYQMFTGIVPFRHEEMLPLLMMHMNEPVPSPRKINPKIPPELEAFILKLLEKSPSDRYKDCLEIEKALAAIWRKYVRR